MTSPFTENVNITTVDMHTAGEPVRIIETGFPQLQGASILDKRRYLRDHLDHYRKFLMFEPRGHSGMFGVLLVEPDVEGADIGVVFMHNDGYVTMCGHAVIAIGRYAVDKGLVKHRTTPETRVGIQCPCGLVETFVEYTPGANKSDPGKTGSVRFQSVPAFPFEQDVRVDIPGYGALCVDISYGGNFFAFITDKDLGMNLRGSPIKDIVDAADAVTRKLKSVIHLSHPDSEDLNILTGTIVTDDDKSSTEPAVNLLVFGDKQVDRSPTGSGVTARMAQQYNKGQLKLNQVRRFQSGANGSIFTGKVVREITLAKYKAVIVEVSGKAYYTGTNTFTAEPEDTLGQGFLVK